MRVRKLKAIAVMPLAAAMLISFPATAQQQTWREASSSGDRTAFIDTASIQREGDKVRFWREVRSSAPMRFDSGESYDRLGAHMEVDCRARTLVNLEVYAKLGDQVIASGAGGGGVEAVAEGSTADTDLRAACFNEWPD